MNVKLVLGACVLAAGFGALFAFFGGGALVYAAPLLLAVLVLADYRIAVVFLTVILQFEGSPLIPQAQGFNPITYCVLAALISLGLRRIYSLNELVLPPKVTIYCVVIPLFAGAFLALPHLRQGLYNFSNEAWSVNYLPGNFLKAYLLRPMILVVYSVLIANAIKDSRVPERFLALTAFAASLPAIGIVLIVAFGDYNLDDLETKRSFLGDLGMHSNGAGKLLAFIFAPVLWMTFSKRGLKRLLLGIVTILILTGVLLTMTRATYLAVIFVVGVFLWRRRQMWMSIAVLAAIGLFFVFGPVAFQERVLQGMDPQTIERASTGNQNDTLTAGRTNGYVLLAPEVLKSPIWGSGTASTAWSDAVTERKFDSIHPHNLYLSAAMDIGLVGLALTIYFYLRHARMMRALEAVETISPELRAFFAGSAVGVFGIMIFSLTNGTWFPEPDSTYMWISYGFVYSYWYKLKRTKDPIPAAVDGKLKGHLQSDLSRRKLI